MSGSERTGGDAGPKTSLPFEFFTL